MFSLRMHRLIFKRALLYFACGFFKSLLDKAEESEEAWCQMYSNIAEQHPNKNLWNIITLCCLGNKQDVFKVWKDWSLALLWRRLLLSLSLNGRLSERWGFRLISVYTLPLNHSHYIHTDCRFACASRLSLLLIDFASFFGSTVSLQGGSWGF